MAKKSDEGVYKIVEVVGVRAKRRGRTPAGRRSRPRPSRCAICASRGDEMDMKVEERQGPRRSAARVAVLQYEA